jgi:hypothetical protein
MDAPLHNHFLQRNDAPSLPPPLGTPRSKYARRRANMTTHAHRALRPCMFSPPRRSPVCFLLPVGGSWAAAQENPFRALCDDAGDDSAHRRAGRPAGQGRDMVLRRVRTEPSAGGGAVGRNRLLSVMYYLAFALLMLAELLARGPTSGLTYLGAVSSFAACCAVPCLVCACAPALPAATR